MSEYGQDISYKQVHPILDLLLLKTIHSHVPETVSWAVATAAERWAHISSPQQIIK